MDEQGIMQQKAAKPGIAFNTQAAFDMRIPFNMQNALKFAIAFKTDSQVREW
jgi:hypothetical protein